MVVVAGLSRPRAWAVWRMVTKGTTATRARVSAKIRMVRFGSSFVDLTGEKGTIPTDEVGYRCGMSPREAKGPGLGYLESYSRTENPASTEQVPNKWGLSLPSR